ncbi:MAG TPA: four helix bundle protein [Acidimicrobiia bacterium]
MQDFRQLRVWSQAMSLCERVYEATSQHPTDERFGMVAQSRRSAVSVASNIAEGAGRPGRTEFARFLGYALGSLSELETQVEIARRVGVLEPDAALQLTGSIKRLGRRLVRLHERVGDSLRSQLPTDDR